MDTKAILAATVLFVSLVAAGFAIISNGGIIGEKANAVISSPVGYVIDYINADKGTVGFRTELAFDVPQTIGMSFSILDSLYVDYGPESKFTISGLALRSASGGSLELVDYSGKATISDKLAITGTSKRIRTDTNTFSKDTAVKVEGYDVDFTRLMFDGIVRQDIHLTNVTGNVMIIVDGKEAVVPLGNKELKIDDFSGMIQHYGDRIIFEGEGRLDFGFMKAPSD